MRNIKQTTANEFFLTNNGLFLNRFITKLNISIRHYTAFMFFNQEKPL